jgi:hypothetical protein
MSTSLRGGEFCLPTGMRRREGLGQTMSSVTASFVLDILHLYAHDVVRL